MTPTTTSARSGKAPARRAAAIVADVVGPVCETGDFLALGRAMAAPEPGDLLAVMTAGAYGAVQAGTYNTRPLVPEVMVNADDSPSFDRAWKPPNCVARDRAARLALT